MLDTHRERPGRSALLACAIGVAALAIGRADAQTNDGASEQAQPIGASTQALLKSPVSRLYPGAVPPQSTVESPVANDQGAAARGMQYFLSMNCVGCHAPNGGGGMGPALSNSYFQYGSAPAQIYLTIVQGRPNGMPAWGNVLPDNVVWDLVAYIQEISKEPVTEWGTTISAKSPSVEQVPAEFQTTSTPWRFTEPFSFGQKPQDRKEAQLPDGGK